MNIKPILFLLGITILLFLLVNTILYDMVKQICDVSELKPVRYELGGLFGDKRIPIVTTPENADGYEKVCIRTGEPKFWTIADNIEYLVNKTKEVKNNE